MAKSTVNILATSASEPLLYLLEITHPSLEVPVRVTSDSVKIIFEGNEYIPCPFEVVLTDDVDKQIPKASLSVDNIGRDLTQWLEVSNGGKGAECRIIALLRSDIENPEVDITLDMSNMAITQTKVTCDIGFDNTLGQYAVGLRYDPRTSPGVF